MALPSSFKSWTSTLSSFDSLSLKTDNPILSPGPNEVLVKICAISLNYRDTEVVMGLYNHHKTFDSDGGESLVPCSDMCGSIVQIGPVEGESKWKIGSRVLSIFNQTHLTGQIKAHNMTSGLGLPLPGVLAEYRVFPAASLVAAPDYLTDEEACTLPIAAMTAWMAINGMRPFGQSGGKGEIVLIQGTGGVAVSGLQIAVASGAEVIITSSSNAKLTHAKSLGAKHTINYRTTPNWEKSVNQITNNEGVDIIFENGGAKTLRQSFDCIAFGGLINCIGYLSGKEDAMGDRTNTNVLALMRNVTLKGILNGPKDRFEEMLKFYDEKKIRPVVDKVFSFGEAKEGLEYLFKGGHFGKVVVKVAE